MKVDDSQKNSSRCLCPTCPTYNGCMNKDGLKMFCARGKTACQIERQGCLCGECPVASDYQLTDLYFCEIGPAK